MAIQKNLNIPAIIVRTVNGKEKQLSGTLISVNESMSTCTMVFNGKKYNNIPMNQILVNEKFIDKIKEVGKKTVDFIKRTVKGFITLVDEATGKFIAWSGFNIHNIAIQAKNNMLPAGVYFAPSQTLKKEVGGKFMDIDTAFAPALDNDRKMIERYWRRVINRAGTTPNETIEESVKYVNEHFYKVDKNYKKLNEGVIYTLDDMETKDGYKGLYGARVDAEELKSLLFLNFLKQIDGSPGKHSGEKPLLIWGAPGIGKTAIIESTIKDLASDPDLSTNLNMIAIQLAGYTRENWTLPSISPDTNALVPGAGSGTGRFTDCPKTWLPVYLKTSDPEEAARRDEYCATGAYINDKFSKSGIPYEGGIVFFDEYTRTPPEVQNIIMKLIQDYKFGDNYVLSCKWGTVFAANRSYDDLEDSDNTQDRRYYYIPAMNDRFTKVTYVPNKEQWLDWATSIDPITHRANVAPFITEFIAQSDEHVWYSTVMNGGYDDVLNISHDGNKQVIDTLKNGTDDSYQTILQNEITLQKMSRMITPRTWTKIWESVEKTLIIIFRSNVKGMTGAEYYQSLVDKSTKIKTDNEGVKYKEYYGGILPNVLVDALNSVPDKWWELIYKNLGGDKALDPSHQYTGKYGRYNKFMSYVRKEIALQTGDAEYKSPLIRDWDEYNSYAKYITDDVINSIWETGKMPPRFQEDDDFVSNNGIAGYASTTYSKWKTTSQYCTDIIENKILKSYPGDLMADMQHDIEEMKNNPTITDEECFEVLEDARERCAFNLIIDNKPVKREYFFVPKNKNNRKGDLTSPAIARAYALIIRNSIVCKKFMNILAWATKITIQTDMNAIYKNVGTQLMDMLHEADPAIFNEFTNAERVNATRREGGPKLEAELMKSIIGPIYHMLEVIKNVRGKEAVTK